MWFSGAGCESVQCGGVIAALAMMPRLVGGWLVLRVRTDNTEDVGVTVEDTPVGRTVMDACDEVAQAHGAGIPDFVTEYAARFRQSGLGAQPLHVITSRLVGLQMCTALGTHVGELPKTLFKQWVAMKYPQTGPDPCVPSGLRTASL